MALNPSTPPSVLDEILEELDLVLVMTVNPGFGGQEFIDYTLKKIRRVRQMLEERNPGCELEADGGSNPRPSLALFKQGQRCSLPEQRSLVIRRGPRQASRA